MLESKVKRKAKAYLYVRVRIKNLFHREVSERGAILIGVVLGHYGTTGSDIGEEDRCFPLSELARVTLDVALMSLLSLSLPRTHGAGDVRGAGGGERAPALPVQPQQHPAGRAPVLRGAASVPAARGRGRRRRAPPD